MLLIQSNQPPQHQYQQNTGYHSLDAYSTLPLNNTQPAYSSNVHYNTLPGRNRGRGRFNHQEPEFQPGPAFRSITPDRAR